jgi:hypothetical protein
MKAAGTFPLVPILRASKVFFSAPIGRFCFSDHARCRRFRAITAIFAALCLCPSATTPTPHGPLLKAKAEVQFDKTVIRLSKPFFPVFHGFNLAQFQPCFFVFAVQSAEGRK